MGSVIGERRKMIVSKIDMESLPDYCESCSWYGMRPDPDRGISEGCELAGVCIDDDQPEEWIYDGNKRPEACPLVEIEPEREFGKIIIQAISPFDGEDCYCSECDHGELLPSFKFCPYCGVKFQDVVEDEHIDIPIEYFENGGI